jgi:FtsH-binding integral membrane protein
MSILSTILLGLGLLISLVGGIWFLVKAFQQHIGWGLCCMFVPFASLVYLIKYWNDAKKPFLISLVGTVLAVGGSLLAPKPDMPGMPSSMDAASSAAGSANN